MTETATEQPPSTSPSALPQGRPQPKAMIEVLHPITWFPPMWAFTCGVVSSGVNVLEHWGLLIAGIILTGPLVCATSQVVNDWYDRDVDAINEPNRPIPSGRLPGRWGYWMAVTGTALSLLLGAALGFWVLLATIVGLIFAWIYSAPPLRLKNNGWFGNAAVGFSYESLAWITGAAVMLGGAMPDPRILVLALLYGLGAHGIMTLNDFKAIEGDRQLGVRSLPVQLGVQNAARVACAVMLLPQFAVVWLLFDWVQPVHAAAVAALVMVQAVLMARFLENPVARATWLSALGVTVYVSGMMISAFAVRAAIAGHVPV
jgi:chlorophyll synthase